MRKVLLSCLLLLSCMGVRAQYRLQFLWETKAELPVPESILYSKSENLFYVSMVDGLSAEMDGKGAIAKINTDGSVKDLNWATGLHAPKGMGVYHHKLYVADMDAVAVIDLPSGKILNRITIEGAKMLNDLAVAQDGSIYVTDSKAGRIHVLRQEQPTLLLDSLVNPNGILAIDDRLYFVDSGVLYALGKNKKKRKLAEGMLASTDGLQQVDETDFLVSAWAGAVYYVQGNGKVALLLDTQQEKMNTADFYYDKQSKVLYVPTFYRKTIAAYQLKKQDE